MSSTPANPTPSCRSCVIVRLRLRPCAACNVWYLGSVALESLTGQQAVQKATSQTLSLDPAPPSTVVHFKVSAQGITLTDNQRKSVLDRGDAAAPHWWDGPE